MSSLAGCARVEQARPRQPPADQLVAVQVALEEVVTAVRNRDRPGFDRVISSRDPGFVPRAQMIFANLTSLRLTVLTLHAAGTGGELPSRRQDQLGPEAWLQQVVTRWQLPGDEQPAEHRLWVTFRREDGRVKLAGNTDQPLSAGPTAAPLWWLEPVTLHAAGPVTALLTPAAAARRWLDRGQVAATATRRQLTAPLAERWSGRVVLEVPSTRQAFERVLGVSTGSYRQIAAVAWPVGPDPATAPVRVIVNPGLTGQLSELGLAVLLAHEVTHVATHSAGSPAPTWLVEGFADFVAYRSYPRASRFAADPLLARIAEDGPPAGLPSDSAFDPDAPRLAETYAQAWLACRLLAERYGTARLSQFYALIDGGTDVDRAARTALGISLSELTSDWRHYLVRLADR